MTTAPVDPQPAARRRSRRSPRRPHAESDRSGFTVRLANFTGPFDLLLQLIGKHKLDVTEVALHRVTDEFIAYIRAMGDDWDLDEASEFLVIAATLLDLKAARLLPAAEVEDEEDLALLEARDLLFARLLQYKAFKEAAAHIAAAGGGRRRGASRGRSPWSPGTPRRCPTWCSASARSGSPQLAVKAMTPKPVPDGLHRPRAHGPGQRPRARRRSCATGCAGPALPPSPLLCADCESTLEVVARFLALLELYREGLIDFAQEQALDELTVRWTGPADGGDELRVDEYAGSPEPARGRRRRRAGANEGGSAVVSSDERGNSLADQAAAWVPPWARQPAEPQPAGPQPAEPGARRAPGRAGRAATSRPSADEVPEQTAGTETAGAPATAPDEPVPAAVAASAPEPADVPVTGNRRRVPRRPDPRPAVDAAGARTTTPSSTPRWRRSCSWSTSRSARCCWPRLWSSPSSGSAPTLERPLGRLHRGRARLRPAPGRRRLAFLHPRRSTPATSSGYILDGQTVRLTQAALETLAVVAYKQPVTRSRISAIRGVNCDGVLRTLVARGLVEECGTEPDSGAFLYRTTTMFLEKLGLNTVGRPAAPGPVPADDVEELADAP